MLEAALAYPTRGEGGLERLFVGGVLVLLSVFLLPIIPVYGYLVRSLEAVAAGEETPPPFDDWGGLFVDGLVAFLISLVYGVVPVVLGVMVLALGLAGGLAIEGPATGMLAGTAFLGVVLVSVVALLVAYLVMAALSNFAVEGHAAAAFDLGAIRRLATSGPYLLAVVLAIAIQIAIGAAVVFATVFTFGLALLVLFPLGSFVTFWVYLVTVYLFGSAYREAMGESEDESREGAGDGVTA